MAFLADETAVVSPVKAVLELADAIYKVIIILAGSTGVVFVFKTSLNSANAAFQFEVRHALGADTSVVLLAAVFHLFAGPVLSDKEATFARVASKVVVTLAFLDNAAVVSQLEGRMAFRTSVVGQFHFASQEQVVSAAAVHQRVFLMAKDTRAVLGVVHALSDPLLAFAVDLPEAICTVHADSVRGLEAASQILRVESSCVKHAALAIDFLVVCLRSRVPLEHLKHSLVFK